MGLQFGKVSEKTLKVRDLMNELAELGTNPCITIQNCKATLTKAKEIQSESDDVFVNAACNLLDDICADNKLSEDEKRLLSSFASVYDNPISDTPITQIKDRVFLLTGDFEIPGGKGTAESVINAGGGITKGGMSKKVNCVVVGAHGSEAWAYGNFGNKVKKALDLKLSKGLDVDIISENAFFSSVQNGTGEGCSLGKSELDSILNRFGKQAASNQVVSDDFQGLTSGQQQMMDAVKNGHNVYLTGLGGTGKSYVLERIIEWANEDDKNVIVCAPTGIAALNIGGTTIHNALGIRPEKTLAVNINPWISEDSPLLACDLMIVDEISMCRADLFDYLSLALKNAGKLRKGDKGTCQLVVVGDFCQLPPVLTNDEKPILEEKYGRDIGHGYPFMGNEWDSWNFKHIELTEAIRQRDIEFVSALNACRIGNTEGLEWIERNSSSKPIENAIVLCGLNKDADSINKDNLDKLPAESFEYRGIIEGEVERNDISAPVNLVLKKDARVMALTNSSNETYMNGSIGTIVECHENYVEVQFDNGNYADVSPHTWEILKPALENGKTKYKTVGTYRQIPLKLAYAITIHKSQGQTFDAATIYPRCWEPGQLYTALSRLTSIEGLHLAHHCADGFLIAAPEVIEFYEANISS